MVTIEGYTERKDKRIEFFTKNRKVISSMVKKAHKVKLIPEAITIANSNDIFSGHFFSDAVFNSCAYITKVDKDELSFYRTIYKSSAPTKIKTTVKNKYFWKYYERVMTVFLAFYEDINIVWITSGNIKGDVTSIFSRIISPSYKINDNYIKFVCRRPRFEQFKSVPSFLKMNEFNFIENDSDDFMDTFFERFNNQIIPNEPELKLNKDMDLNTLKDRLTLISMMLI